MRNVRTTFKRTLCVDFLCAPSVKLYIATTTYTVATCLCPFTIFKCFLAFSTRSLPSLFSFGFLKCTFGPPTAITATSCSGNPPYSSASSSNPSANLNPFGLLNFQFLIRFFKFFSLVIASRSDVKAG